MKQNLHSYIAIVLTVVTLMTVSGCRSTWNVKKSVVPLQTVSDCSAPISGSCPNTYKSNPITQATPTLDLREAERNPITATSKNSPKVETVARPEPIATPVIPAKPPVEPATKPKVSEPLPPTPEPSVEALDGRNSLTQNLPTDPPVAPTAEEPANVATPPFQNASLETGDEATAENAGELPVHDDNTIPVADSPPPVSVSDDSPPSEQTVSPAPPAVDEEKPADSSPESKPEEEKEKNIVARREGMSYAVSPTMSVAKHEKVTPSTTPQEIPIQAIVPGGRPSGYSKSTYASQPLRTIVVP